MAARGERSAKAAQIATLDTRRAKQPVLHGDQRTSWRERAADHGLDLRRLDELLGRVSPALPAPTAVTERLLGAEGLTKHASSFDRRDVLEALAEAAALGATVSTLEDRTINLLADSRVVELNNGRYTTADLLELERGLLDTATDRRHDSAPRVPADAVRGALGARPTTSDEQREMVARLVASPGGVQVVLAAAGTGKTFALDAAREAWQYAGVPVLGCALSARAACELRDQAAVDATTIARLRMALDDGYELQPGSVLLVDEAGMVGTRDLAALAQAAARANARPVLIGDDHQLSEIEAGGGFSALAERLTPIELHDVRRQVEPWDRAALAQLRNGDVELFARAYAEHGRLVTKPNSAAAREALVGDWWHATHRGQDALMLAHRRADVADLNARARSLARAAGYVGEDLLTAGDRSFSLGDRVLATRNDRQLGVHNGQTGTISTITSDELALALRGGDRLTLPLAYARAGHLDHAYALTAHRAQGATVDATFVLGSDELYREWGYTALSRHRDEARFYLSATPNFLNAPAPPLVEGQQTSVAVARALTASRRQRLASAAATAGPAAKRLASTRAVARSAQERHERLMAELDATPRRRRHQRASLRAAVVEAEQQSARLSEQVRRIEHAVIGPGAPPSSRTARARDPLGLLPTDLLPSPATDRSLSAPRREQPQHNLTLEL